MSGIFGFTYRYADEQTLSNAVEGLKYWNQSYGHVATDCMIRGTSAIGCHIEHFSDRFSFGGPILGQKEHPAVVDALIYNRDELTSLLDLDSNHTLSDEELLLHLIKSKGFDSLAQVNGDFAGAIFDPEANEWTLFRDHLGVRPLYIYLDASLFAFSTDLRGLASLPGADCKVDEAYIYQKIAANISISLQSTEFANIRCTLPGGITHIRMNANSFSLTEETYWRIGQRRIRLRTDQDYSMELRRLITDAVNRRCDAISGVLGAELSGGLDSGVIDILMSRHGRKPICYSWSNDPSELPLREDTDERKVVLDICAQEGLECRFRNRSDMLPIHTSSVTLMPPNSNTPTISFGSAWLKSQGANVVFSGHTGDEGVSHRAQRYELVCSGEILSYFKLFWQDNDQKSYRLLRTIKQGVSFAYTKWKSTQKSQGEKDFHFSVFDAAFHKRLHNQVALNSCTFSYDPLKYVRAGGSRLRMDTAAFQGALNGVRYLFPYADYRVFDYALSIPRRLYLNQTENRVIFRETFRDIMPKSLYDVRYKDDASTRDLKNTMDFAAYFKNEHEKLLKKLDRKYWDGILDFDAIETMQLPDSGDTEYAAEFASLLTNLRRCILIQDFQTQAQKWREVDE